MAGERGPNQEAIAKAIDAGKKNKPEAAAGQSRADRKAETLAANQAKNLEKHAAERAAKIQAKEVAQQADDAGKVEEIRTDLGIAEKPAETKVSAQWDGKVVSKKDRIAAERANVKVQAEKWAKQAAETRANGGKPLERTIELTAADEIVEEPPKIPEKVDSELNPWQQKLQAGIDKSEKDYYAAVRAGDEKAQAKARAEGKSFQDLLRKTYSPDKAVYTSNESQSSESAPAVKSRFDSMPGFGDWIASKDAENPMTAQAAEAPKAESDEERSQREGGSLHRPERNAPGGSYTSEGQMTSLPGMDAGKLGAAMAESRAREAAGQNLDVQDVQADAKPSMWSKFKGLFRRSPKAENAAVAVAEEQPDQLLSNPNQPKKEAGLHRPEMSTYTDKNSQEATRISAPGMNAGELGRAMAESAARGAEDVADPYSNVESGIDQAKMEMTAEEQLTDAWDDLSVEMGSMDAVRDTLVSFGVPKNIIKKYPTPAELSKFLAEPGIWATVNGDKSATEKGVNKLVEEMNVKRAGSVAKKTFAASSRGIGVPSMKNREGIDYKSTQKEEKAEEPEELKKAA